MPGQDQQTGAFQLRVCWKVFEVYVPAGGEYTDIKPQQTMRDIYYIYVCMYTLLLLR